MRVVLFTDADVFAGTERHILDLGRALREVGESEGVKVWIACPHPSPLAEKAAEAGLPVVGIAKRGLLDWRAVRRLRRALKAGRFDIIHAHNGRTALAAALAVWLARRGKCVSTQHFLEPGHVARRGPKALVSRLAHGWVTRHTHAWIAISEAARQAMLQRGEAPAAKISTVPNGIALPSVETLVPPEAARAKLDVAPGAPLVVCAARLEREKDVASLVAAMPGVVAAHAGAVCVAAGEGSLQEALREQVQRLGLQDAVRLPGFVPDVLSLINACDVFVLPSPAEPFGLVLLEAMALSKPVVATRAGGPLEIVAEGESGVLVPPSNPDELERALNTLLSNSEGRRLMGEKGRARFEAHFLSKRMARDTLRIYRGMRDEG